MCLETLNADWTLIDPAVGWYCCITYQVDKTNWVYIRIKYPRMGIRIFFVRKSVRDVRGIIIILVVKECPRCTWYYYSIMVEECPRCTRKTAVLRHYTTMCVFNHGRHGTNHCYSSRLGLAYIWPIYSGRRPLSLCFQTLETMFPYCP